MIATSCDLICPARLRHLLVFQALLPAVLVELFRPRWLDQGDHALEQRVACWAGCGALLCVSGQRTGIFVDVGQWSASVAYLFVPQAWTLALEIYFYAMAPFMVRLQTRYLMAIAVLLVAIKTVALASGLNHEPWVYRFFPFELPLFLVGMVAYRAAKSRHWRFGRAAVFGVVLAILLFPILEVVVGHVVAKILFLCAVVATLPAVFQAKSSGWDQQLGELSYPLYLCHIAVMRFVPTIDGVGNSEGILTFWVVLFSVLASVGLRFAVDWPVNIYRQRRLKVNT